MANLRERVADAIDNGNEKSLRRLVAAHPEVLAEFDVGLTPLQQAAFDGQTWAAKALLQAGADVNALSERGQTALGLAATDNHLEVARVLLDAGANPDLGRVAPLCPAAIRGHDQMVRLLIQHGADVNVAYVGSSGATHNALSQAVANGRGDVAALLRQHGAKLPAAQVAGREAVRSADAIVAHMRRTIGPVQTLSQQEIVSTGLPISIHVIKPARNRPFVGLFTTGMSEQALPAKPRVKKAQYGELAMCLPRSWPLDPKLLRQQKYRWPFAWLRNIARQMHAQQGGTPDWLVVSTSDPPKGVCRGCGFEAFLIFREKNLPPVDLPDGRTVGFFSVIPLYEAEAKFCLVNRPEKLMKRFKGEDLWELAEPTRESLV